MAPLRMVRRYFFGDLPPLSAAERRLVLRVMTVTSIPLALITTAVLIAGGAFAVHQLRERTEANKDAIAQAKEAAQSAAVLALRLDEQRDETANALAWQVYDQCVENENQDESNTALYRKVRTVVAQGPPTAARDALIEQLNESIDAREPEGEMDCPTPERPRPAKAGQP